jgi:DNA-binding protein
MLRDETRFSTMETHIADITRAIQLAVAPVFLLTAIGTIITALNNRLSRAVDRRRVLQDRLLQAVQDVAIEAKAELATLARRSRLIYFSILAAVTAALLVCLVVACAFVAALLAIDLSKVVAVLFILAMCALVVCLTLFLREIFIAVSFGGLKLYR